jgi:predicted RNase H-like nuclease (RuvC/YqgF family)
MDSRSREDLAKDNGKLVTVIRMTQAALQDVKSDLERLREEQISEKAKSDRAIAEANAIIDALREALRQSHMDYENLANQR